jgi:hypothetical protein
MSQDSKKGKEDQVPGEGHDKETKNEIKIPKYFDLPSLRNDEGKGYGGQKEKEDSKNE